MKRIPFLLITTCAVLVGLALCPCPATAGKADGATSAGAPPAPKLRAGIKQPYIVKKGDTLWDIANYFFRKPTAWLKIWEHNLYITNPDLIYPGNKIWYSNQPEAQKKSGGLTTVHLQPRVRVKPVERLEAAVDTSLVLTALKRQDFIRPDAIKAAGYVLDSLDERINYGANDRIYLRFPAPVEEGGLFDVFRSAEPVRDPASGEVVGMLIKHLGQVRVTANRQGISEGVVVRAFEEISRGDRLTPARKISTRITPNYPQTPLAGRIIHIRNHAAEAGQNQIVGINLGANNGLRTGSVLQVMKAGRVVRDRVSDSEVTLPEEKIGELIVLSAQNKASIALVTRSTAPINIGDSVHALQRR